MSEKNEPKVERTQSTVRSSEVNAGDAKGEGTHTTIRSAGVKTDAPKIEGSHTQETVHPAERLPDDPDDLGDRDPA
jgi:hypothetical protein